MATEADIQRWLATANRSLAILTRRLGDLDSPKPDAQGLSMLHLTFAGLGYAHVAARNFTDARYAFSGAVHAHNNLYDLFDVSQDARDAYDRAGNFQTLLMAHATGDSDLISSFRSPFLISDVVRSAGPPDSTMLASMLIALESPQPESAISHLENVHQIDPQFHGYSDCFGAIARRDVDSLTSSLVSAANNWRDFASTNFAGLPQSAFFLDGVAVIHLARRHNLKPHTIPAEVVLGLLDG